MDIKNSNINDIVVNYVKKLSSFNFNVDFKGLGLLVYDGAVLTTTDLANSIVRLDKKSGVDTKIIFSDENFSLLNLDVYTNSCFSRKYDLNPKSDEVFIFGFNSVALKPISSNISFDGDYYFLTNNFDESFRGAPVVNSYGSLVGILKEDSEVIPSKFVKSFLENYGLK